MKTPIGQAISDPAVWLGWVRIGALVFALPWGPGGIVPLRMRLATALLLGGTVACTTFPEGGGESAAPAAAGVPLLVQALLEAGFGALIGWTALLAAGAVRAACSVLIVQAGLEPALIVDPASKGKANPFLDAASLLAVVIFFHFDLHLGFIEAVARSLESRPPGSLGLDALPEVGSLLLSEVVPRFFLAVFTLALPACAALFAVNVLQGILSRAVPELETLGIGLAVRVLAGAVTVALLLPESAALVRFFLLRGMEDASELARALGGS